MKKENWQKIAILATSIVFIIIGEFLFYPYKYGLCIPSEIRCIFGNLELVLAKPLFIMSCSYFIVSLLLFLVSINVFKKWIPFAIIWIFLSTFFIAIAPVYGGGWVNFNPTKELVSIWMGSLFIIISLIMFAVLTIKEKKSPLDKN